MKIGWGWVGSEREKKLALFRANQRMEVKHRAKPGEHKARRGRTMIGEKGSE
jgi:hypothetical protein